MYTETKLGVSFTGWSFRIIVVFVLEVSISYVQLTLFIVLKLVKTDHNSFYFFLIQGIFQRRYSVNRALLSTGLGVVAECSGFKDPKAQDKFHRMLMKSEREAQSRGRGVWEGSEHVVWWRRLTRTVQNIFKSR